MSKNISLSQPNVLVGSFERKFISLQEFLVPRAKSLTTEQKKQSIRIINDFLSQKTAKDRFRLKVFFYVIDFFSIVICFGFFAKLSSSKQMRVMNFFFKSPIGIFRKGFWGVNTLAKMSVYCQDFIYEEIHYIRKATPQ